MEFVLGLLLMKIGRKVIMDGSKTQRLFNSNWMIKSFTNLKVQQIMIISINLILVPVSEVIFSAIRG
jgi:hypothetical protein